MRDLILEDTHVWEKISAADLVAHDIVNRDRRKLYADMAFWLGDSFRYPISDDANSVLHEMLRDKLGHKRYHSVRKQATRHGLFVMLARYIDNDEKRFEWVITQLQLLGFSDTNYPRR